MENQLNLEKFDNRPRVKTSINLKSNPHSLEFEKEKFIQNMCGFIDRLNFDTEQINGRPRSNFNDIMKSLLMMSFNSRLYFLLKMKTL